MKSVTVEEFFPKTKKDKFIIQIVEDRVVAVYRNGRIIPLAKKT